MNKRVAAWKAAGLCVGCGKAPPAPNRSKCEACLKYFREWNKRNPESVRKSNKGFRVKLRSEVLQKYGGKCQCCGEDTPEFLAIDHKNNDGNKERRRLFGSNKTGGTVKWYTILKDNPVRDDLQLLCHNCNIAKSFYGECPHQKKGL